MNGQTIRTITIRGTSEGLDKLTGDLQKLAAAEQNVAVVSDDLTKRQISLEQAYKRQSLRLDEAARAQANFARETKLANDALRQGVATPEQHARSLELINQRYGQVATSAKQMIAGMTAAGDAGAVASQKMIAGMSSGGEAIARGTGLARHELINLSRQAQDVGVSLVSGQSPLMILAQQGTQIADVFISSGKSVGDFFSQAIGWAAAFAKTPAGIVTGVLAIGAAAAYAAYQFTRSSTTVEQALAEQTRLMKENKTAADDLVVARIKLQSSDLRQFQTIRSELDLRTKLKQAAQETAETGRRVVSGEEGFPATGPSAANANAGYARIKAAVDALNASIASGKPAVTEYITELGRIGTVHPELARTTEFVIRQSEEAAKLEEAWRRIAAAKASVALIELNNLQAVQAAEAAERQAKATLELAALYPGMSIEVAKQLSALQDQLQIAQARTGLEEINIQYYVTQNRLLLEGKTLEEAMAIAAGQRAVALAQVNAEADRQLKTLQQEGELIRASSEDERERLKARQTYQNLVDQGVDANKASAIAAQQLSNAQERSSRAAESGASATADIAKNTNEANEAEQRHVNALWAAERATQAGAAAMARMRAEAERLYEALAFVPTMLAAHGGISRLFQSPQGGYSQFDPAGYTSTRYTSHQVPPGSPLAPEFSSMLGLDKITDPLTRLALGLGPLTEATKENTEATSAMTDVLSPFYSSDPRRTHLGFRAFVGGGIMTQYGELPLKHYQGGGMATSPQVAMFGEGSTPEAYVPVPSGRIPVEIKAPANNNQRPITVNINVLGNADDRTVGALKSTAFQQAQTMRRAMS